VRTLRRHERQEILDRLRAEAQSASSKRDIQTRQHFMERSFAHGTRFGLKRARWRGQWRVQIQDYLIAIVQNVELLIDHAWPKPRIALGVGNNSARALPCPRFISL
jgi:Transposase DDE domain